VVAGDIEPPQLAEDERAMVREAADIAASLDWSDDPWHALANALKASTGRKGKALFHPLRLALTGRESGPEMAGLLARIGKDRAVARLAAAANA
jgi:glutamyl-tRNA synthetase